MNKIQIFVLRFTILKKNMILIHEIFFGYLDLVFTSSSIAQHQIQQFLVWVASLNIQAKTLLNGRLRWAYQFSIQYHTLGTVQMKY